MNSIFKFVIACVFSVMSTLSAADTFNFNYYYPPGGGTEQWSSPVVDGLRGQGHTVNQEFFKSCHAALSNAVTQHNGFVVMSGSDIMPSVAGRCPAQKDFPTLTFVSNLGSGTIYLCTSPRTKTITLNDLSGPKTYNVAMSAAPITMLPWAALVKNSSPQLNLRAIPYKALSSSIAATIAGTDVELIYIATGVEKIIDAGGVCIASSTSKNFYNLPFLGQFAPTKFKDTYVTIDLWATGTVSTSTVDLLTSILKSKAMKDFSSGRPSYTHLGLGANISPAAGYAKYLKDIEILQ